MNTFKSMAAWVYLIVFVLLKLVLPIAAICIYAYLAIDEGRLILATFFIVLLVLIVALITKTWIEVSVGSSGKHRHPGADAFKETNRLQYHPAQNRRGFQL